MAKGFKFYPDLTDEEETLVLEALDQAGYMPGEDRSIEDAIIEQVITHDK